MERTYARRSQFKAARERSERARSRLMLALLAFVVGLVLFVWAAFTTTALAMDASGAGDYIQNKVFSLRVRLMEWLPQPAVPEFVPTPFASVLEAEADTPTPEPSPTALVIPPGVVPATSAPTRTPTPLPTRTPTRVPVPAAGLVAVQDSVALTGVKHDFQRWNNCGPTTLEMNLSFFGLKDTQVQIASVLKPNPEDKNVRPDEMAAYVSSVSLRSTIRVNGTLDGLKLILSNGLPVIVETEYIKQPQGWMGHYRLLTGYDDKQFNAMDSYDGPNTKVAFDALDKEWKAFNRLYILVYRSDQEALVRSLLGSGADDVTMYTAAANRARADVAANPKDAFAQFNLGMSLLGLQRYKEAAAAFDQARLAGLPWRMMWYQFGPYQAYLQVGRYDEVIALADATLKTSDDLEEGHYYKGMALRALGKHDLARTEFETALKYNKNYRDAQGALDLLRQ